MHPPTPQPQDDANGALEALAEVEGFTRRSLIKRAGAASATLAIPALLGGFGDVAAASTRRRAFAAAGSTLNAALATPYQTFDPAFATTVTSIAINTHVFEPLVEISLATRKLSPALAAGWPTKVNPTTYHVKLRQGAKWQDGSAVTASDVVYSFQRVMDPKNASFFAQFNTFIKSVKALDAGTVEFKLHYPTDLLTARLPTVKIVPQAIVTKMGATAFGLKPVGSGPYSFVSATNNASIVLNRFSGYNGPRPGHIDTLNLNIQTDATTRESALRSGQILAMEAPLDRDVSTLSKTAGLKTAALQAFEMQFLMFNCKVPKFQDVRVRQALHYAIDLQKIAQDVFLGNATPAVSYLPQNHPNFIRPKVVYNHNPAKAKALLSAAGYSSKKPLSFELLVYSDVPWIADTYAIVQQNWANIGVKVQEIGGGENLYNRVVGKGNYEAFLALADQSIFGWDAGTLLGWHYGTTWTETLYFWKSPYQKQMLNLLTKGQKETNTHQQFQTYAMMQQIAAAQVPLYPLHHRKTTSAWSSKGLSAFTPIATSGLDLRSARLAS